MKRKYNLDLLRVITMLLIVLIHSLGHGKLIENNTNFFLNLSLRSLQVLGIVAVNVFVLMSSYLMTKRDTNYKSLIKVIIQTLFYSYTIYLFLLVFKIENFEITKLPYVLFPIMSKTYWYVTAYVGLYLFIPFLNALIESISKKTHFTLILISTILFSVIPTFIFYIDTFNINNGYSLIWFIYLFFIGSYIRIYYKPTYKKLKPAIFYLTSSIMTILSIYGIGYVSNLILGVPRGYTLFLTYNSVLTLIASISFFILFLNIKVENNSVKKTLAFVAPKTFAVYLIHDNRMFRNYMWGLFKFENYNNTFKIIPIMLLAVLSIFIISILIETIRSFIFNPIYKLSLWDKIDNKLNSIFLIEKNNNEERDIIETNQEN